eukprot:704231-Rhodomonas_salina.1
MTSVGALVLAYPVLPWGMALRGLSGPPFQLRSGTTPLCSYALYDTGVGYAATRLLRNVWYCRYPVLGISYYAAIPLLRHVRYPHTTLLQK